MSMSVVGYVRNGVVVPIAPLPEGARVEITVNEAEAPAKTQDELGEQGAAAAPVSMREFLESLPPGPRAFKTWEEYERHLREEKDAWDC